MAAWRPVPCTLFVRSTEITLHGLGQTAGRVRGDTPARLRVYSLVTFTALTYSFLSAAPPPPTGEAEKAGGSADAGFALQTSQPHVWTCLLFCWAPRFSGIAQREATDHAVASRPPWHVVPDRAARPRLPVQAVQMHRCACVRSRPLRAAGLPPAMCLTLLLFQDVDTLFCLALD